VAPFRIDFSRYCLRRPDITGLAYDRVCLDGTLVFGKRLATIAPLVITSSTIWSYDPAMAATPSNTASCQSDSSSVDDNKLLSAIFKWTTTVGEVCEFKHDGGGVVLVNHPARTIKHHELV
tara:strand:- start:54583 stop:54945 length:363 start_codon:yes stop_codon:yes gene_type:complete